MAVPLRLQILAGILRHPVAFVRRVVGQPVDDTRDAAERAVFPIHVRPDLELRLCTREDTGELQALAARNQRRLAEWFPSKPTARSWRELDVWIVRSLVRRVRRQSLDALLWHQGRIVGLIGCLPIDRANRRVELFYWLDADAEGRGLMTAAVRAVTDHAFRHWDLNRVEIRCAVGNVRSAAVARRLGFVEEGRLRQALRIGDQQHDLLVFGLLRANWPERARPDASDA